MTGWRDVLAHDSMGVDLHVVWGVTQGALPDLERQIQTVLNEKDRA